MYIVRMATGDHVLDGYRFIFSELEKDRNTRHKIKNFTDSRVFDHLLGRSVNPDFRTRQKIYTYLCALDTNLEPLWKTAFNLRINCLHFSFLPTYREAAFLLIGQDAAAFSEYAGLSNLSADAPAWI